MNWTRDNRSRMATPRLDESDEASDARSTDSTLGLVSADIELAPFLPPRGGHIGRFSFVISLTNDEEAM